jgi:hypothetical protein
MPSLLGWIRTQLMETTSFSSKSERATMKRTLLCAFLQKALYAGLHLVMLSEKHPKNVTSDFLPLGLIRDLMNACSVFHNCLKSQRLFVGPRARTPADQTPGIIGSSLWRKERW